MASTRIKKKTGGKKAARIETAGVPRQGAIPCLILLVIILGVVAFFFFAGLHVTG